MRRHRYGRKYDYVLYEIKKTYEEIESGDLYDISKKYSFNQQTAYQAWKNDSELYGKYIIKRKPI